VAPLGITASAPRIANSARHGSRRQWRTLTWAARVEAQNHSDASIASTGTAAATRAL
jgi:hypothetical protein